jgi:glycerophosphoryl diester phosphodiesterase
VFVEVKRASITHFGIKSVFESVVKVLGPILKQAIIISFDLEFVKYAKQKGFAKIAWVFDQWHDTVKDQLFRLQPEYVFTDSECVPTEITKLWPGPWRWAIYEIDDPQLALKWITKGAELIETNDIGGMLKSLQVLCEEI